MIHFYIAKRYEGGRWNGVPEYKLLCTGEYSKEESYSTPNKVNCVECLGSLLLKYEGIVTELSRRLMEETGKQDAEFGKAALEEVRKQPCCNCNAAAPSDPNHIKTRGAGGKNELWNLIPMCRRCHTLWHDMGWYSFISIYPATRMRLESLGWEIDLSILMKPRLLHPKLVAFSKRTQ